MRKRSVSPVYLCAVFLFLMQCASKVALMPFGDVQKQNLVKNRAVFALDVDLSEICKRENVQPSQVVSIKLYGTIFVTAEGISNVYAVTPCTAKKAKLKPVKLKREKALPFERVQFEWEENEKISFQWKDAEGEHANVIGKNGKVY